ncbi:hypothetical protein VTJ49DRAFT_5172 [Mycothermus thermophilus]|uniref:Zn(2)-C6 fungal-type domain-containing protein n=1 Tax=Humicola insolens TaxID=85995 RepID=A0ABR3V3X3_HUMIN
MEAAVKSEPSPESAVGEKPAASSSSGQDGKGDQPQKKANPRKRTKTGCLTCRKRRIKCDEGKPTCSNCIKSKRECEGYSRRLKFTDPLCAFNSGPLYGHPVYQPQVQQALLDAQITAAQTKTASSHAVIAPKPPSVDYSGAGPLPFGQGYGAPSVAGPAGASILGQPHQLPSPPPMTATSTLYAEPPSLPAFAEPSAHGYSGVPRQVTAYRYERSPVDGEPQSAVSTHYGSVTAQEGMLASPQSMDGQFHQEPMVDEENYWQSDDEASMVDSDDEAPPDPHLIHLESNDLGIQVARQLEPLHDVYGTRIRSFAGPASENILATYTPSSASSPLNDTQTAAIFWYFVNVTGQSMSLYERHPFDPTPMFQGRPVPKHRQHIWTYTFPIMAFNHPALMQAMLALGSLQLSKLQGSPPTAAMKHYHLSLRRVAKNYQSPTRRTQPATLAATLLLGFYEVWNSDHDKWCKHMWGARAILRELPLRRLTREVLAYRRRQREEKFVSHKCNEACYASHAEQLAPDQGEVDPELIYQISGQRVDYSMSDNSYLYRHGRLTERDVEQYEQLRDLYWWYCKMDVYQSFLGGTRPLMEWQEWTQCTPRGPFGKIDSIHGTFDMCMLLLGRLADFASRDLARKRRAWKSGPPGGGPPGMGMGMGRGSTPPFAGLMPTSGRVSVPRGFSPPRESSPSNDSVEDMDFDASTARALREWEEIRQAFEVFRARLGPDFEPMGPDYAPREMTPFGPALMYRTYSIAGVWMNYYMGLIVLYRSHPSMPPLAVAAAGMSAHQTGKWANEIARIAAGLHEDTTHVSAVSTLVGAAFIESSFPLFVAGVQFQDIDQRHWMVLRLRDVARLTGWQSALQIVDGCETAWTKAAEMGRGPPYHSPPELGPLFKDSVWNRPRRIERRAWDIEARERGLMLATTEQTHYALGLLSVEKDLGALVIDEEGKDEGNGRGATKLEEEVVELNMKMNWECGARDGI